MIRSETEYAAAQERLKAEHDRLETQRVNLHKMGLESDQVQRALDPMESFHLQLKEELECYDRLKKGEFSVIKNLHGIGQLLIGIRISQGMSQRELASKLGAHESQVCRDERNEYSGVTLERAARIFEALGVELISQVIREQDHPELVN